VLVLHGGGGEGLDVALTGNHPLAVFRTVADREGFVVVYPGGLPAMDGNPGWDDCRGDNLMASGADDAGFLDALIARLRSQYGLPASRVFMAGGSNGAQMTLAYAITRATNLAAVATANGNLPENPQPGPCSAPPARAVPALMVHGTADLPMPYAGGCVADLGGGCARGRVITAEATRDYWLNANGLAAVSPVTTVINLADGDGGPANRSRYAGADPVAWWRLDGAGHPVPSRTVLVTSPVAGLQNRDVEFAEIAWEFFAARLPASSGAAGSPAAGGSGAYTVTRSIGTSSVAVPAIIAKPVADTVDALLLFHGTVEYDSLVPGATQQTLAKFGALLDRDDLLLVSVAYPEEGLLLGDNYRHAEAALLWVRERAAQELGITVGKIYLAGHSQGGYLVTRLNAEYEVAGVIASAPGPLNLGFRCGLEEDGKLAPGLNCGRLYAAYGSTRENPGAYAARSLLGFTGQQRSPVLFVQGLDDSPIQIYSWPTFRAQLEACGSCAERTFLELPGEGHPALFESTAARQALNDFLAQH
jgi:poly(3-hydroxybutyrate) depolymerase